MFSQSVIAKTGQMWKFWLGVIAVLVGSIAPLFEQTGITVTVGTIIAVVGYGLTVVLTKCPACGSKWFGKALLDAGLYGPLFKTSECPVCKQSFD